MADHARERLPEVMGEASRRRREAKSCRQARHFIKGPLPMPWLEQAARLPGKALAVGLLLWFMKGMKGEGRIKLSLGLLSRFSVGRKAAGRALTGLEQTGLIRAERGPGRLPRVQIINFKSST